MKLASVARRKNSTKLVGLLLKLFLLIARVTLVTLKAPAGAGEKAKAAMVVLVRLKGESVLNPLPVPGPSHAVTGAPSPLLDVGATPLLLSKKISAFVLRVRKRRVIRGTCPTLHTSLRLSMFFYNSPKRKGGEREWKREGKGIFKEGLKNISESFWAQLSAPPTI